MMSNDGAAKRALPKPIPERLKEAREARGFSMEAFAETLDVSRQSVAQYETGQSSPSGDVMARIIATTRQPPIFFVTAPSRSGTPILPFWRSLKRMEFHHRRRIARRLEWALDITTYISLFIELPEVNIPEFDPSTLEAHEDEMIERAAEMLRDRWGMGRGPIQNLVPKMEENGVILIREPVDCEDMDAVCAWQRGRPFILYSEEVLSGPRTNFNLAHELGHIILHAGVEVNDKNLAKIERQANHFAGAFLLPRETFGAEVLGTSIGYLRSLKSRWGVAISAMAYRAKDLGIFNVNQQSYVMKQLNALNVRVREPLDDAFVVPAPSVLGQCLHMLITNGVQTRDQIERALGLNLADVESICCAAKGLLDNRVVQFQPRERS